MLNPTLMKMSRILLTLCFHLLLSTDVVTQVTFKKPPPAGATVTIEEDKAPGSGIYIIQADDPSGNVLNFTILSQSPSTPSFSIDASSDNLLVPSQGLDADNATLFSFTFGVTAGSNTATSGLLTVRITDVNDNDPVFKNTSYTGEVWKNDPSGLTIATVSATDPDISNLSIIYSIAGAQTTFLVNSSSGVITLADPSGLTTLSSPTVLQVHASDGGRTATATVNITIHDDPCSATPCQNGGTCTSTRGTYTCTCLSGYDGDTCQSVDYCYQSPCQNVGTCINLSLGYRCNCTSLFEGQNCTTPITTITTTSPTATSTTTSSTTPTITLSPNTTQTTVPPSPSPCQCKPSPKSVDIHLIVAIVVIVLCCLCIAILIYILKRHDETVNQIETQQCEANKTDEEKCTPSRSEKRMKRIKRRTKQTTNV